MIKTTKERASQSNFWIFYVLWTCHYGCEQYVPFLLLPENNKQIIFKLSDFGPNGDGDPAIVTTLDS